MAEWFRPNLGNPWPMTVAGVAYLTLVVAVGVAFGWYPPVADLILSGDSFVSGALYTAAGTFGVFLVGAVPAYLYGRADLVAPVIAPVALLALIAYTANPESYAVLVFFYPPLVVVGAVVLGAVEYAVRVTVG